MGMGLTGGAPARLLGTGRRLSLLRTTADNGGTPRMTNRKNTIRSASRDAMPLLMRARIIEAVLAAQRSAGEPVTAAEARLARSEPVMRNARSFSEVAKAIAELGPDERGRVLRCAGFDRNKFALWWVEEAPHHGASASE